MEKNNLFFAYLNRLIRNKKVSDNDMIDNLNTDLKEVEKTDNEWHQEYELIYSSYAIDSQ